MKPEIKRIPSSIHNYELIFENDLSFIQKLIQTESALFILDSNVYRLYSAYFTLISKNDNVLIVEAKEEVKTFQFAGTIIDKLVTLNLTRKSTIISIGGGIIQDLSGFVASTFFRGINWIYVPTTLLAQADSCMGSKTSLNYNSYKNILGTFYPPHQVFICPLFTNTLIDEDFYSGMGEVVKLHTMGGFAALENLINLLPEIHKRDLPIVLQTIKNSLKIKWQYMEYDEFDTGKRNLLNYGHCFGHAIESAVSYTIPHGQAVIIGMVMSNWIAFQNGQLDEAKFGKTISTFMDLLRCNYKTLKAIHPDYIVSAMKKDKKRIGANLPLIWMDNQFQFHKSLELTEEQATKAFSWFTQSYC